MWIDRQVDILKIDIYTGIYIEGGDIYRYTGRYIEDGEVDR